MLLIHTMYLSLYLLQIFVGQNLNYSIGQIQYGTNSTSEESGFVTSAAFPIVIAAGIIGVILILIVIALCIWRHRYNSKKTVRIANETEINMYSSPAYGTHQVFSEPGLDHLYEPIDDATEDLERATELHVTTPIEDAVLEKSTEFNDGPQNEIDSERRLKVAKSDEATAQNDTSSITEEYLRMDREQLENENHTTEACNDEDNQSDTGYVNDDEGTAPYLRVLKATEDQAGDDCSTAEPKEE